MKEGEGSGRDKSETSEDKNDTKGRDLPSLQTTSNFQGSLHITIFHLFFSEIFLISPNIQHLLESLETLEESGLIPLGLLLRVVFQYDRTVASLLSQTEDQYTLEGRLAAFRLVRAGEQCL